MKELICKNCGSKEFTIKDDELICKYCHTAYDRYTSDSDNQQNPNGSKRNIFDSLVDYQKEAYAESRRSRTKGQKITLIMALAIVAVYILWVSSLGGILSFIIAFLIIAGLVYLYLFLNKHIH